VTDEELSKPLPFGKLRLGHPQEGRHHGGGLRRRRVDDGADLGQRHAEAPQPGDQPCPLKLG
jgi:hypothetical protein